MPDQSSLQAGAHRRFPLPDTFEGIGYTRNGSSLPLQTITAPVPQPGPDQILIHVQWSSLNPLEYKLALLNFLGRQNPVILGFDMAGTVVQVGDNVHDFQIGDEVMAMGDSNLDGGWASGGEGGYALARNFLTAHRPTLFLELHLNYLEQRKLSAKSVVDLLRQCGYSFFTYRGAALAAEEVYGIPLAVHHVVAK